MRTFGAALVAVMLIGIGVLLSDLHMKLALIWPWFVVAGVAAAVFGVVEQVQGNAAKIVPVAAGLVGLSVWFVGWVPAETPGYGAWPWGFVLGGPVLLFAAVLALRGRGGSRGVLGRWSRRSRRNGGVASRFQIWRKASKRAMRRKARTLKPSLKNTSWWQRRRTAVTEYAARLARVGWQWIWSPVEDVTLTLGGPRSGKTGHLAGLLIDAPGAVLATSTRTDLIELTAKLRVHDRGPVWIFNPSGLGKLASTITFDPLTGCENPVTATYRAADLLPGEGGSDEREHWVSQARRALATLMHAAALGELSMAEVAEWVAGPERAADEVLRLLRRSPEPMFATTAEQFLSTNDRTRSSITTTIMPALAWLTDPTAKAAATGGTFDVAELLESKATVYLLGAEEAHTAPLLAALTGHIARAARQVATESPSGRLDTAFTLILDEAALVAPVPLDRWTADMGGRNITIHIGAQSRAQLRQRWGDMGCAAIMTNSASVLILAGARDPEDLQAYSLLTCERHEMVESEDESGRVTGRSPQRVAVLSPGEISQLPERHVVVVRRGMAASVGKLRMAWQRRDVKALARAEAREVFVARWSARHEAATTWLAGVVDTLADLVEPWVRKAEQWAANRKATSTADAGAVGVPAQDHAEPIVRAETVRLDVPATSAPAGTPDVEKGTEADPLAALDAELDAEVAGWTDRPAADERGDGR